MKLRNLLILFTFSFTLLLLPGCSDQEDTTPSLADKDRMEELIDSSIPAVTAFRDQYGSYLLYEFDQNLDFAYQFEEATNWQQATIERLDRQGASDAVDYLCEKFFPCYSDAFKTKYLPRKILLVKSLKAKTLGLGEPDGNGYHNAAANANSLTIAFNKAKMDALDEDAQLSYLHDLHAKLLAQYLINIRAIYPADDAYLAYSQTLYSSLMEERRTQARHLPNEFFLDRGFFRPADDESTYFISAEEDMIEFTRRLITMDEQLQDSLADYPVMESKLGLIANGLQQLGVDIAAINPLAKYYLEIGAASVPPSVIMGEVLTPKGEADFSFTILRGSRKLVRADIYVNGQLQQSIDLSNEGEEARITKSIHLTDLHPDSNPIEVRIYEEGRPRPSVIGTTVASYVSKASYLHIENSLGEKYRLHVYDHDYTDGSSDPNVSSIRFRKIATSVDMETGIETGGEQRFWIIYKEGGLVKRIIVKQEVIDYVNLKNSYEPQYTYEFLYNEQNQLTAATKDGRTVADKFVYEMGLLIAYNYEGKLHRTAYDTSVSPALRLDCLDAELSGYCFRHKGNEMLNYFYQPAIPAVIPGTEAGVPLQLLYSKYLFTELCDQTPSSESAQPIWSNRWLLEGNTNMTEVTLGDVTWTYTFILQ